MKRLALYAGCSAVTLCAAALLSELSGAADRGAPPVGRTPHPSDVVLQLQEGDGFLQRLTALGRKLEEAPGDAGVACAYAKLALEHYAVTGDARFLGFAEGTLARWRKDAAPPAAIWILRGRVLQAGHRFREAGSELDRMIRARASSVEALLLAADAWRRAGEIEKAKARCAGLALAGRPDLARWCTADVLLSLGENGKAWELVSTTGIEPATAQWALAVAADAAAATGRTRVAESHYRRALGLPGASIALHVSYADLLLRDERPRDALAALAGLPDADAVLLRRAMAAKRLDSQEFADWRDRLARSFAHAEALGAGALHLRERAMFELYVESDARAALAHAQENWRLQKGPEDAALLVRSALAAGKPGAAETVLAWRRRFGAGAG